MSYGTVIVIIFWRWWGVKDHSGKRRDAVSEAQARIARQAYRDFGKTSGHPYQTEFLEIASPMRWRKPKESRFCSKDKTSRGPM